MLNTSQTGQMRDKADAGFQRAGNGDHLKNAGAAMQTGRREAEPARGRKAPAPASSDGQTAAGAGHAIAPTHDEIAARAQQVYEKKGRPEGRDTENWLEAEAELRRERGGKTPKR
jgi:hypothetical protein